MFNWLLRDPRLRSVLLGNRVKAVREIELGQKGNKFLSADLTAASDRIPIELALALWSGFYKRGLLDDEEWECIVYALGP